MNLIIYKFCMILYKMFLFIETINIEKTINEFVLYENNLNTLEEYC